MGPSRRAYLAVETGGNRLLSRNDPEGLSRMPCVNISENDVRCNPDGAVEPDGPGHAQRRGCLGLLVNTIGVGRGDFVLYLRP